MSDFLLGYATGAASILLIGAGVAIYFLGRELMEKNGIIKDRKLDQ